MGVVKLDDDLSRAKVPGKSWKRSKARCSFGRGEALCPGYYLNLQDARPFTFWTTVGELRSSKLASDANLGVLAMAPHVDLHVTVVLTCFGKFYVNKSMMIKKKYNREH